MWFPQGSLVMPQFNHNRGLLEHQSGTGSSGMGDSYNTDEITMSHDETSTTIQSAEELQVLNKSPHTSKSITKHWLLIITFCYLASNGLRIFG